MLIEELNPMHSDFAAYARDCERVPADALLDMLRVVTVDDGSSIVESVHRTGGDK